MCGIFISLGFAPDPKHIDCVAHRGPDGRGWNVFETERGPLALGHRRLAIIDVSDAGLQPMRYGNTDLWLVFNGEIYNYLELRDELAALGHGFRTQSDSRSAARRLQAVGRRRARPPARHVRPGHLG